MARRSAPVVLTVLLALIVGGCQYLFGYGYGPIGPVPSDEFAVPSPVAIYATGRATIALGDADPIQLEALAAPGSFFQTFGGEATFRNADGWYVRVSGASTTAPMLGMSGFVQLDRIRDGRHWTTADPSRCIVMLETADPTRLKGRADCKGLRWSDAVAPGFGMSGPAYVEGERPFDAVITFDASPKTSQAG